MRMPPAQDPLCSVVVVTWNRRADLERAVASCFAQTLSERLEVIVVDNASTDGTREWVLEACPHPVRYYAYSENLGCCVPRNAGVRLARAPYVCFLDSDAEILAPDALERSVEFLETHAQRAVAGSIWLDHEKRRVFARSLYLTWEGIFDGFRSSLETEGSMLLTTCFSVWDKALLLEVGGFDPWYFYGSEDIDLSMRVSRRIGGNGWFTLLDGVDALHRLSPAGRTQKEMDFAEQFNIEQRRRMRLILAYGGIRKFLLVLLLGPLRIPRLERRVFLRRLTWGQRWRAFFWWPFVRLLNLPRDWTAIRRDHLAETTMPRPVRDPATP